MSVPIGSISRPGAQGPFDFFKTRQAGADAFWDFPLVPDGYRDVTAASEGSMTHNGQSVELFAAANAEALYGWLRAGANAANNPADALANIAWDVGDKVEIATSFIVGAHANLNATHLAGVGLCHTAAGMSTVNANSGQRSLRVGIDNAGAIRMRADDAVTPSQAAATGVTYTAGTILHVYLAFEIVTGPVGRFRTIINGTTTDIGSVNVASWGSARFYIFRGESAAGPQMRWLGGWGRVTKAA